MTNHKRKIFVLGLDGATFDLLDPLMRKGLLPNIEHAIGEGVRARLLSTIPPVTGPAWVSFMTGKQPEHHGIFDFVTPLTNKDFRRRVVNTTDIQSETLWSLLTQAGKKLSIVNVPLTYPLPQVNGYVVSGMLTPRTAIGCTHPPSLRDELKSNVGEFIPDVWWQHYDEDSTVEFLELLRACTQQKANSARYLMRKLDWDFFMVVFTGIDRIQHALWDDIFVILNDGVLPKQHDEIRQLIEMYFQEIDTFVQEVLNSIEKNTNFIIMSDHGFGRLRGKFHINTWLKDCGFLEWDERKLKSLNAKKKLRQMLKKADVLNLKKRIPLIASNRDSRIMYYDFLECIQWAKTKAYSISNTEQGIYINLKDREPYGIVKPGQEYEKTRDEIIEKLNSLQDPETNEKLVSRIYKNEEIYPHSEYAVNAPDIIFFLKEGEYLADVQLNKDLYGKKDWKNGTGTHRVEGIFIGYGDDIRKGAQIDSIHIVDLAPTILNILDVPIPDDMDGKVPTEIFLEDFQKKHPPKYTKRKGKPSSEREVREYSEEEEISLKKQLEGLGYL